MLEPPFEFMGLLDGQEVSFQVLRWQLGEADIHETTTRRTKRIQVLRVHVPPEDKPIGALYWDITAGTTISRLRPFLDDPNLRDFRVTLVRRGVPPSARDEVRVTPPAPA
jgi:hypothetical protein